MAMHQNYTDRLISIGVVIEVECGTKVLVGAVVAGVLLKIQ